MANANLTFQVEKTIALTVLELQTFLNVQPRWFPEATLNNKYNILPNQIPSSLPKLQYFGIGIKGFKNLDLNQSASPFVPKSTNLDLYEPIPVKILTLEDDLNMDPTERAKYRMRVKKNINGTDYVCYYLKVLEPADPMVQLQQRNIQTGEITNIETLDPSNLHPEPELTLATATDVYTTEISCGIYIPVTLLGKDILDVINIMYNGDITKARISEIGLYTGVDTTNNADNITYTEAMYVQLGYHYTCLGETFDTPETQRTFDLWIASASTYLL